MVARDTAYLDKGIDSTQVQVVARFAQQQDV